MSFEMSDNPQTIKVFNLRADTHEFIGAGDAFIPPHTGLPADCTDIAPPKIKVGHVAIFDDEKNEWSLVEDHREQIVYNVKTGNAIIINELGSLPDGTTSIAPKGDYQIWNGNQWVNDEIAEHEGLINEAASVKSLLMTEATNQILPLQDAVDVGIATDEEKEKLLEWKKYRVLLNRVDISLVPDFSWPEKP
ncbi:tail fiber assembly protein [Pseudocitrobacter faecalis]|uniref:tail fiber assembly protein n=1 Tax=Pseudocitrobacter faecalis TaxID=1398493 RepID=UPI003314CE68